MGKVLRIVVSFLKYAIALVVGIELFCFLAMGVYNYLLYGELWGHVRVRYDPYALFLMTDKNPPTKYNETGPDSSLNKTIWMFGGSTVRSNAHQDANRTLPAFLARYLNNCSLSHCYSVENLGQNGFTSLLEVKYLQKLLIERSDPPDMIVFYDGANDSFQFLEYRTHAGHVGYRRLRAFIESYRSSWFGLLKPVNAAIYASFTREFADKLTFLAKPVKREDEELRQLVRHTTRRYDHVARLAKCYGSEFVVFWQPMLWVEDCPSLSKGTFYERSRILDTEKFMIVEHSVSIVYGALEESLRSKPFFVSLRNAMCTRKKAMYRPDGIHLKWQGRRIVAEKLGKALLRRVATDTPRSESIAEKPAPDGSE